MRPGFPVAPATALVLALPGLLACACGPGGGGAATGTKFGAVVVETPGPAIFFGGAGFSDTPRLLQVGEFTSLEFGVGEPDGCTKKTAGGCQVFRCPTIIEATSSQGMGPDAGAITITWDPAVGPRDGVGVPPPFTIRPDGYDLFYWQTGSAVTRLRFSAAGAAIPAFPATDVNIPQPFEVTQLNDTPVGPSPPTIPRAADVRVTWTGGTADAVFVLRQLQVGSNNDLMAVCRAAASAGSFTFPSGVMGEFQPGDVSLHGSVVSSKVVAAGDYATTLAIAAPLTSRFVLTLE